MNEVLNEIIRVGLVFGAVFQLICIAAVIWVPSKEEHKESGESSDDEMSTEGSCFYSHSAHQKHPHGKRRHEKKKRR
ncbi:hypothetical protein B4U79_10483 [Dinothrombium tinctorium]|uniref:Uncharacterized protein n=1 Tax=Dinothrombium tinctorium TaxID=1965070 RepID=A0A3S3QJK9_9ACAR|nr:hypothetical protein B4U79_10483 [Dinothrombium tinctorium]